MAIDKNAVAVPAQSKNLDTTRVTTTYGLVHRQVISIADPESPTAYATLTGSSLNVNVSNATLAVTQSGTFNITNISGTVSLPTGASTATLQTTGNTSLNSIDTKTPALSSGRVPVESNLVQSLTDTQLRASAVPVSFTRLASGTDSVTIVPSGTQTVSGTVTANIGTTNGLALDATVDGLLKPSSTLNAVGSITNTVVVKADSLINQTNAFKVDGSAVTQPISAASLPLPTGAATESTLAALNNKFNTNSFSNINTNTTSTVKSGAGVLKRIVVNKIGTSSNTCTIYDNTTATGTIIGTIDPVHTQMVFEYDLAFSIGLTIVTANGTAADITVIYKQGITYACDVISTIQF